MFEPAHPVAGKTYTLFGSTRSTEDYYRTIGIIADAALKQSPNILGLIRIIDRASKKKRFLKKLRHTMSAADDSPLAGIVRFCHDLLAPYTVRVEDHLKDIPFLKRWDATLLTSEEQYHLSMLMIELANRAWGESFRASRRKIAFLPYCLRDLSANCRSDSGEIDQVCKGCSKACFVNQVSAVLRSAGVEPYIWMNAGLRPLLKRLHAKEGSLGVLGVACVPELVRGMRLCMSIDIPVVGIPLNANRCVRWMGAFHPTSVDLKALDHLVRPHY